MKNINKRIKNKLMKTSNIILLSIFLSVIIGGTSVLFLGIYEAKAMRNTEEIEYHKIENLSKKKTLESFKVLVVKGEGILDLNHDTIENYLSSRYEITSKQKQDTLFIDMTNHCSLHYNNLQSILIMGNISANAREIEADSLHINIQGNSKFNINNLIVKYLELESYANSQIWISGLGDSKDTKYMKFSLSGNSNIDLYNNYNNNIKMEINKSENSRFSMK